ncbi:MAG: hypothetical protein IPN34_21310 [Planctomycetes bacterium]|nr:hypothetical protein [Planctomycetota bacterium]
MYIHFCNRLVLAANATYYSRAVELGAANAARVDIWLYDSTLGGTGLTVTLQVGNDLQNWQDQFSSASITANGFTSFKDSDAETDKLSSRYVRLKFATGASGTATIAAAAQFSHL